MEYQTGIASDITLFIYGFGKFVSNYLEICNTQLHIDQIKHIKSPNAIMLNIYKVHNNITKQTVCIINLRKIKIIDIAIG